MISGYEPGVYTKSVISYLPDRPYFADWMTVKDVLNMFMDSVTKTSMQTRLSRCAHPWAYSSMTG